MKKNIKKFMDKIFKKKKNILRFLIFTKSKMSNSHQDKMIKTLKMTLKVKINIQVLPQE